MKVQISDIQDMIYVIRGQKVMLDSDLAKLYEVETRAMNRQVRRNIERFPEDFMFKLNQDEFDSLMCQIGTSKTGRGGRTKKPLVFSELGIAMLSSVLKSDRAAQVNISIMRIFVKLRSYYALEERVDRKVNQLERDTAQVFKVVFERLDNLESLELNKPKRKKIGLKSD